MIYAITVLLGQDKNTPAGELALLLNDIEIALREKTIKQQEYVELMVDAERLKKIIEVANDVELNQTVHEAIAGLIELAKMAKF